MELETFLFFGSTSRAVFLDQQFFLQMRSFDIHILTFDLGFHRGFGCPSFLLGAQKYFFNIIRLFRRVPDGPEPLVF